MDSCFAVHRDAGALDLDELLDLRPVHRGHWIAAAMCFIVMMADGYDLFVMVQLMPTIAQSFAVSTAVLTTAYAAQTVGQAVGALGVSPFADRFGRKPLLLVCMVLLGLATFAGTFATSVEQFTVTRFISGAFGGAIMPITISLAADIAPNHWRSTIVGIAYAGLGVGGILAAGSVSLLLDSQGWHGLFLIGGILPVVMATVFSVMGMESLRHRARKDPADPRIGASLRRLGSETPLGAHFFTASDGSAGKSISLMVVSQFEFASRFL